MTDRARRAAERHCQRDGSPLAEETYLRELVRSGELTEQEWRLRVLERRWSTSSDPVDEGALLTERLDALVISPSRVRLAAALGHGPAQVALRRLGRDEGHDELEPLLRAVPMSATRAALAVCRMVAASAELSDGGRTTAEQIVDLVERWLADPCSARQEEVDRLSAVEATSFGSCLQSDESSLLSLFRMTLFSAGPEASSLGWPTAWGGYSRSRLAHALAALEQVVAELLADGQPYAVFTDNNLGSNREYLHALCAALRPIGRIWSAAVTLDVTDDPTLVRAMALGGCTGVFIGFESLHDENLAEAGKKTPRAEDYARRVELLHDHGIQVNGSFVLGFDHDRRDVFARTAEWVEANRLECATFHLLTPYPGTPLFRQLEAEGRLLHTDWRLYDTAHVVFRPKHMQADELAQGYAWLYERLFSHASIWRRRPTDARAVLPYLAMSYLYKRSNLAWHLLIKTNLTHSVWSPLVEWTRRRHVHFREQLAARPLDGASRRAASLVSAGV